MNEQNSTGRFSALPMLFILIGLGYMASAVYNLSKAEHVATQSKREVNNKLLVLDDAVQSRIYSITNQDRVAGVYEALSADNRHRVNWVQLARNIDSKAGIGLLSFDVSAREAISHEELESDAKRRSLSYESLVIEVSIEHDGLVAELMQWIEFNAPSHFEITQLSLQAETPDEKIKMTLILRWYMLDLQGGNNA